MSETLGIPEELFGGNMKSLEAARVLLHKLEGAKCPLAVFTLYGTWTTSKVTSKSFLERCRLTPERLVGVYDINARVEDIAQDFQEVGIK